MRPETQYRAGGRHCARIANEALHTVYEYGAGHPRAKLEDEREEQARRFRVKYGTQDDAVKDERGNVVPYFIGVFDTVAALGSTGIKKFAMIALITLLAITYGAPSPLTSLGFIGAAALLRRLFEFFCNGCIHVR
jgi:hypothetical protein